ncbi:MAG TPA: helix-turn-helix domain-containing protein [Candidatus Sulfotelmatobacter sp.]|nr:helix-turn-helix domain-containing protein [Candidatus Sulfotelmatobacter sp.]
MAPRKKITPAITPIAASEETFITPKQLAERLHVKVSTIWDWTRHRNTNPIPHYPISRKAVYYRWSEVIAWIEAQRVAA